MANRESSFFKLQEYLGLEVKELSQIYFYSIFNGLVQLSLPLGIQAIIGFVLGASMVTSMYLLIFLIVLGTLLVGLLHVSQMNIIEKMQQKIFVRYALKYAEKIPNLDLLAVDKYYLPERINYFFDTITVQKGISKLLLDIPVATIQIALGVLLLSLYHPLFIIFSAILLFTLFLLLKYTSKSGLHSSLDESTNKYRVAAWLQETSRVLKAFKFSAPSQLNLKKADEKIVDYLAARTTHYKILLFQYKSLIAFKVISTAMMLILGVGLLLNQSLNIGEFVAVELVIITIIGAIEKLIVSLENIYDVVTGLIKVDQILENPSEKSGSVVFNPTNELQIEFKSVSFAYDQLPEIIHHASFSLKPGTLIRLSGTDGGGKSTLIKLLVAVYHNYSGQILVNDIPMSNYDLKSFRTHVGIHLLENDLFEGTLYENLTMGRNIPVEEIIILAKQIGMAEVIQNMPQAFETSLDPLGAKLASTVTKKILLLRAMLGHPKLLVLEEPWQGLEPSTRKKLLNYLNALSKDHLVIIVTNDAYGEDHSMIHLQMDRGVVQYKNKDK